MAYGSAKARPDASEDKRRFARRKVLRRVRIATLTRHQIAATVRDLSPVGCGLVTNERVAVGSFVEVVFDERIRPAGWVTWSRNGALGVDFDYPLVPAAFEQILIESSPAR
ncbi:PilZ domain-containing protein [Sphingomonas sp. S1-29]|uniref:PilZ domain-containing protein n=1 Tax=Sphingomonas sp. S1-29 TaxID=2991074 RepID=UPI003A0FE4E2